VEPHLLGVVERARRQRHVARQAHRSQRQHHEVALAGITIRECGLRPDGHVRRQDAVHVEHRSDPPHGLHPDERLPVPRQVEVHPGPGFEQQVVAEQVGGLGHPVLERRAGQLGALSGGFVVVGDQRRGGIGSEALLKQRDERHGSAA
jgi:hypothetical protein